MPTLAVYTQSLDPLGSQFLSTLVAGLPILTLFYLLVFRRWLASWAGAAGSVVAIVCAVFAFGMPADMAGLAFCHGAMFGVLPIGWTVFNAMMLYNVTLETGQFRDIRRSVAALSDDPRLQAVLIGFAFGAFLEGSAGSGAPVAVCGAMLVGLGFPKLLAAVICLIANTSPVAYGGIGTPIITLAGVTGLDGDLLSAQAAHQLPLLSLFIPAYMVKMMGTWRQTLAVWPALLVGGGSFAVFQFLFGAGHYHFGTPPVWPITDVAGAIGSMVTLALFFRVWKPRDSFRFTAEHFARDANKLEAGAPLPSDDPEMQVAAERAPILGISAINPELPLSARRIAWAWMPFALMSVFLVLNGFLRLAESDAAKEGRSVMVGPIQTAYAFEIPKLHEQVERAKRLQDPNRTGPELEGAKFMFIWASAAGTPVFMAAVLSMLLARMGWPQVKRVVRRTVIQMRVPIPTIAFMMGLSYVSRYAGMDATLGIAFASTGAAYPFFAAMLGWLGVFLTGTDAGSNALFGSLQKITATEVWNAQHVGPMAGLDLQQGQVLICTANSTGGVMGKMIDAQSICVATAGTDQVGARGRYFPPRDLALDRAGDRRRTHNAGPGIYRGAGVDRAEGMISEKDVLPQRRRDRREYLF